MEKIYEKYIKKVGRVSLKSIRDKEKEINWGSRMIAITGGRGVGKTTMLLQHIKKLGLSENEAIYISLDDLFFSANTLYDFVDEFEKNGGKYLFIDEVHHYKNWAREMKNIYDDFPYLKVVFTGSSALRIFTAKADLSRRVIKYNLPGLSFREFISFSQGIDFPVFKFEDILKNHVNICQQINAKIKPLALFKKYLSYGYYPFFLEDIDFYHHKLAQILMHVLEVDLPYCTDINFTSVEKMKKLLWIISSSVPFKPNISKISEKVGVPRNTVILFLKYLTEANIISVLYSNKKGISYMQKPEKIFIHHPNLMYALANENINTGNLRESFFFNQLSAITTLTYPDVSDFFVANKYYFEVGGKNKNHKQIANLKNAFIAKDDIEIGFGNVIPLWLFGFLY
jgi:predicted AAA+ superfamily ATPase